MTDSATTIDDAPATTSKDGDRLDQLAGTLPGNADGSVTGHVVTIHRPRRELYAYWRDFGNLAAFMENVERIDVKDATRSHWVVKAPGGKTVEWDAVVADDRDGELIAWKSAEGADVAHAGRIEFSDAQGDRGTIVRAVIAYDPPAGTVGKLVAKVFQREPSIQARRDLHRFKQLMETGEVSTNAMNVAQRDQRES